MNALSSSNDADFERIYAKYHSDLLRFVYRFVLQRQTAEDVVQETMLRAWRNFASLPEDPDGLRRWLFTVARRITIDVARSKATRPSEVNVSAERFESLTDDSAEVAAATHVLVGAFHRLNLQQQTVLRELHLMGRKADEVAAGLGIPVGTVHSRAFYAMQAVRAAVYAVD